MAAGASVYEFNPACGCDWCRNRGNVPDGHADRGHAFGYAAPHVPPRRLGGHPRALLCVMNIRAIPECITSFEHLDCDVAWMSGYTDAELGTVHQQIVDTTDYDFYLVVSDDCIVTQPAVDAVLQLLAAGHPAATGWCRLRQRSPHVNLCYAPLIGDHPNPSAYPFYTFDQVAGYRDPVVPTHFMGFSLTGMPRELWRRFPYGAFTEIRARGYSSDFHLCVRLRDAGVPMVAAREGYVEHLKVMGRKPPSHKLLFGKMPQQVRLERRAAS